jgi:heme/copper-type cytochrome/quinol oxidase subunit 2
MQPWGRWLVLGGSVVVIALLFVALRPDDAATPTPTPPTPSATATPTDTPSGSPSPSPTPNATVIEVTVRGDRVQGPERPAIRRGEQVILVVHADVTDHVHVHGYDLMADVAPGRPARLRFRADVPGVFEVELEDAGRPLRELEIGP